MDFLFFVWQTIVKLRFIYVNRDLEEVLSSVGFQIMNQDIDQTLCLQ